MNLQKFEGVPDERRLTMMLDLLRYENAAQAARIGALEGEIAALQGELEDAREALDELQSVLDMQAAGLLARDMRG